MNGTALLERIRQSPTFNALIQSVKEKTLAQTQSNRGNLYEKVNDITIKLGFHPDLSNDTYDHYEGNINTCKLKKVENMELYLQNSSVFGKGKGGSSDITLRHKVTGKWIFVSSKFYLNDSKKTIDKYDVEKVLAVIQQHPHKYKTFEIYLLVNNKKKVIDIINSCEETSDYIKNNIHHILDINDMESYYQHLHHTIQDIPNNKINETFCTLKNSLQQRFHQDLITHKMIKQIDKGEKELLLGAKARSGKTYCVGGLFVKYYKKYHTLNALIITPAPTETISQFTDDLFHKCREFNAINIIEIKKGSDIGTMRTNTNDTTNHIIIVSKQLLDDYVFEKKVKSIQELNLDMIVFDESHFHGTTQMSKHILKTYASTKTVKVFLTATYAKPLQEYVIPMDCRFYWDIEDEQMCKARNINGLVDKHGPDVLIFVTEENKEQILGVYDNAPDLHIITNMMDPERYHDIKERIKDTSYGFSNTTLFSGKYPNEVDMMLRYITGSHKETDYPHKDESIFGRIKDMSIEHDSRTLLNNGDFTTLLWFLPFGIGLTINKSSEHVKERMMKNPILKNYEIKIVNSKKEYKLTDVKEEIKNWELKAKEDGKTGLILLAGNQLTLGITLPFVDVVFLCNDILSSDKIVQMMYRCMTESIHNAENDKINDKPKKMGFVVDLNISRVLNTLLDYNIYKKNLNVEQKIRYLVENHLINIDADLFRGRENQTKLVEKLLHIWKGDPINHLKILLKKIEDNIIDLDTKDQQNINKYFAGSTNGNKVNITIPFNEESEDPLPTGKKIVKGECGDDVSESSKTSEKKEINISLTKDVLPFIIPLICILTMDHENKDIMEMLNIIKTNPALVEVFQDQTFIWWNKTDIIRLIETLLTKYVQKNSVIYNIAFQFKMSLQSLIDNPKELLELIDSCLKPKQKEKQENGEVFTPMCIINEMLNNLDTHYTKEHGSSIFNEPTFKWFDPASGMGNFPVAVYLRLMEGLKQHIPNDENRKTHIIEDMLYMSEINKKNCFVTKQIFNMNNEYGMNLYEGDTLELDTKTEWGIDKFDVILGNPPYNKGGIRSHTGKQLGEKNETIWTKFIENSFDWLNVDGFLVFINPLSWLKKSHSLHKVMLGKYIVWLKLWDNIKSLSTINGKIPISLFILQNTPNITNNKTIIISEIQSKKLTTLSTEYLNPKYSIPLAFHSIFNKLIQFIEIHNIQLEYKTKTVKSSGTKTKLPTEYTIDDLWAVDTYTIKEGILVKKATEQHPDMNKQKLIIANKASFTGAFIDEGKLSLTGNHKFYILETNLEIVKKMLDFKIINIIGHYTKYGQDFLDNEAFKYLPDIRKLGITDITEDEFYTLIKLTENEIKSINNSR